MFRYDMEKYEVKQEVRFVEAIDDGRIVKVPEDYAVKEGLMILRRPRIVQESTQKSQEFKKLQLEKRERDFFSLDKFRKSFRQKNDVIQSLLDNFHWVLTSRRKQLNLTRKQVALAVGMRENDIKMIENGILPSDDYVLINKLQQYYGVNLRRDGQDFNVQMREIVENAAREEMEELNDLGNRKGSTEENKDADIDELIGDNIEIIDEK